MKKISFIGSYDKIDFMLYVAKLLVEMGKKVIVVDGTLIQKAKYVVPTINPSKTYITEFEGIDVAIGFKNFEDIERYLGESTLNYDIALVDVDMAETVRSFEIETSDKNYFVTSFDLYSLRRGLEALNNLVVPINITKILFSKDMSYEENEYLDFLSLGYKIQWEEERIYLPFEVGDQSVIYSNQMVSKIKYKRLSNQYKEQLRYVATQILKLFGEDKTGEIKATFKRLEKGV